MVFRVISRLSTCRCLEHITIDCLNLPQQRHLCRADSAFDAAQAKQYRESQRLGLLSQEEFVLDTSALSKRKADMVGVAAWPEDNEGPSDDDFDADTPSQVASLAGCSTQCSCLLTSHHTC